MSDGKNYGAFYSSTLLFTQVANIYSSAFSLLHFCLAGTVGNWKKTDVYSTQANSVSESLEVKVIEKSVLLVAGKQESLWCT